MRWLSGLTLAWLMVGCQMSSAGSWEDALLAAEDAEGRTRASEVIAAAIGSDVQLASDAFARDSLLTLEHTSPGSLSTPAATGRVMERPEQFRLVRKGSTCALIRVKTEEVLTLEDVRCTVRQGKR